MANLLHRLSSEAFSAIVAETIPASMTEAEQAEAMALLMADEELADSERCAMAMMADEELAVMAGW